MKKVSSHLETTEERLIAKIYISEVDEDHIGPPPYLSFIVGGKEFFLKKPEFSDWEEWWQLIDFFSKLRATGLVELQVEKISPDDFKLKKGAI